MRFPSCILGGLLINRSLRTRITSNMAEFSEIVRQTSEQSMRSIFTANNPRNVFSISVTGGGVQALSQIFSVPGASNSVVEGNVPYARQSLRKILNSIDEYDASGACTAETAVLMSKAAYQSAVEHVLLSENTSSSGSVNIFGVSCNAALVSDTPKKGPHRCHIAVYSGTSHSVYSIELDKSRLRTRMEEDSVCSQLVIDVIRQQCRIPLSPESLLSKSYSVDVVERVEIIRTDHPDLIDEVRARRSTHAILFPARNQGTEFADRIVAFNGPLPPGSVVFPGSFNPLHEGHVQLAKAYLGTLPVKSTDSPPLVVFEIAVVNADKPPLSREEVERRVLQFYSERNGVLLEGVRYAVCVTSEPLFVGKSNIFKGCTFVVGADTCSRLIDSKYYADKTSGSDDGSVETIKRLMNMSAALTVIKKHGCKFVVGGRVKTTSSGEKVFETLTDIMSNASGQCLPSSIVDLFEPLDESQFRVDLSSTELRSRGVQL